MVLELLLNQSKDSLKDTIHNLSDSEKTTLLTEIEAKKKSAEDEYIRLETMKAKLDEDEAAQMEKLKSLGIASYSDLDTEINKLETELEAEIAKYVEALKEE